MKKVIVFNGPPRCAKDSASSYLYKEINSGEGYLSAHVLGFKEQLTSMTAKFFNMTLEEFLVDYDEAWLDGWHKDKLLPQLTVGYRPHSQRTAQIHVSENVAKPMFGKSVFGDALANKVSEREGVILVPDSGFKEELYPVIEEVGSENLIVIQIHRDGCSFEGDSRNWLEPEDFPNTKFISIKNNRTLEDFYDKVSNQVSKFLKQ